METNVTVKFALGHATKAQRGSRGIAILFLYYPRRWMWWVVNATPLPLYPGKDPVPIV